MLLNTNNKMPTSNITFITIQNKSVLVHVCFVLLIVCLYICLYECLLQNNNHETRHKNNTASKQHSWVWGPLRECRSILSGASGLPYYCTPLVCISVVIGLLAVWQHNKPKTKKSLGLPHTPSFSVCLFTWVGVVCVCFLLCLSNKFTMKYTQIKNEIWVNIIMNSNKITFLNLIDTCVTESIDVIIPLLIS